MRITVEDDQNMRKVLQKFVPKLVDHLDERLRRRSSKDSGSESSIGSSIGNFSADPFAPDSPGDKDDGDDGDGTDDPEYLNNSGYATLAVVKPAAKLESLGANVPKIKIRITNKVCKLLGRVVCICCCCRCW